MRPTAHREVAAVFAGGVAGTLARAGLAQAFPPHAGHWPWITFGVNVAGAFVLGTVAARPRGRLLVGTGLCGALTTFSALQLELVQMLDQERVLTAGLYAAASLAAGLAAVAVALRMVRAA